MEEEKQVIIQNGTGTTNLINGIYAVTGEVKGYNNASIDPTAITVNDETSIVNFTISATGTLTLHVTETGESTATAVQGAIFKRCDSEGNEYGNSITSNENGNAVFNNIPYDEEGITIYYKQTASDGKHNFNNTLLSTNMTEGTKTVEVINSPPNTQTINLTDANYENLPIEDGTINFNKS